MATINTHPAERRYTPDRRTTSLNSNRMTAIDWIAMTLLIVGGINWGLVGLFSFNLVAAIFGEMSALSRIVYVLVGLSAVYSIFTSMKMSGAKT
jgi:uncharacterized membrane protein YuzA (DUF378 family)